MLRFSTLRFSILTITLTFVAFGLLACGDDDPPTSEPTPSDDPAAISVSAEALDYGEQDVGTSERLTLTIENTGEESLSGNVDLSGDAVFTFDAGDGSLGLAGGASQTVGVTFTPSEEGEATATVEIAHDAPNADSPLTVALTGEGVVVIPAPPPRP